MSTFRLAISLATAAILAWAPSALAQSAASFIVAIGTVQVFDSAGQARQGARGGALASGDRVITGADGLAQIRFSDGAMLSVRANSDLKIEAHSYTGETDTLARTVLQLLRGGLRAITGAVARVNRAGYKVVTPTATIGVRGTDFEAFHVPASTPGGVAPPGEPGTYLRVSRGVAFLETPRGLLDVQPQQIGFVPVTAVAPRLLLQTPQFMLQAPQTPAPAPKSQSPQRSQEGGGEPTVRQVQPGNLQQTAPGRVLTPQTTSPQITPGISSPTTVSPSVISPQMTAPMTAPISPQLTSPMTAPTAPQMTAPMTAPISPQMTAPITAPISPQMTAPMTAPISPQMTAPMTAPMTR